jgi:uncharacterized integral membrane protein
LFPSSFRKRQGFERQLKLNTWDAILVGPFVELFFRLLSTQNVESVPENRSTSLSPHVERKNDMPLIQILLTLIVVGVLLWLVNRFIPMEGSIKSILNGVVIIAVVLWLLNIFGLFHSFARIHVGT